MAIEIKLSRADRVYRPSENLEGNIIITSSSPISHHGIKITIDGTVTLQVRSGVVGVIDSLYGSVKPMKIMSKCIDVSHSKKLNASKTLVPFTVTLAPPVCDESENFFETFHGANIRIQYLITADVIRGYLHKPLSTTMEFIIESDQAKLMETIPSPDMVSFYITQDTQGHSLLPELLSGGFRISGKMVTQCALSDPLTGDLTVEASAVPIESIDIQLLHVESILVGDKFISETSVIQTTQVADGDVCRSMMLPIYIIIPRLLTCPTVSTGSGQKTIYNRVSSLYTHQFSLRAVQTPFQSWPEDPQTMGSNANTPFEIDKNQEKCMNQWHSWCDALPRSHSSARLCVMSEVLRWQLFD